VKRAIWSDSPATPDPEREYPYAFGGPRMEPLVLVWLGEF
jgi:hypothetical protein